MYMGVGPGGGGGGLNPELAPFCRFATMEPNGCHLGGGMCILFGKPLERLL